MSALISLPKELITMIFENLDHINDALNLANTCGTFKAQLATDKRKTRLMRRIMGNSHTHDSDIQLCRLLTNSTFSEPWHSTNADSFLSCYRVDVDQLNDDEVLAIVGLRQRIRPVQKVYLNPSIQNQYRMSSFPAGKSECTNIVECMFQDTPTWSDAPEKSFSAKRFSDAVMRFWVLMEARKLILKMGTSTSDLQAYQRYLRIMESFWCGNGSRTLLETLDMLEVHDFLYGFLIRKIYYRAWPEETEEPEKHEPVDRTWARNLQLLASCLSPVDAARIGSVEGELADPTRWKTLPVNLTEFYLLFQEIPRPLSNFGIETLSVANILELNLGYALLQLDEAQCQAVGTHDRLVDRWIKFRRSWPQTARGTIFHSLESSEGFLKELKRRVFPEPKSSRAVEPWEDPFSTSLSPKAIKNWSRWLDQTIDDRA